MMKIRMYTVQGGFATMQDKVPLCVYMSAAYKRTLLHCSLSFWLILPNPRIYKYKVFLIPLLED